MLNVLRGKLGLAGASRRVRWSDNDRHYGPFTYSYQGAWKRFSIVLTSGNEYSPSCSFRVSAFGHTLILALPAMIRPWREKIIAHSWTPAEIERMGGNFYYKFYEREYGFCYGEGFLQVFLGRQTHDSSTTQVWCKHLPWTQWRHVRRSMYGKNGEHFWDEPESKGFNSKAWDERMAKEAECPKRIFHFQDFDGEALTATTRIEEREWRFGTGWFKWLSVFRKPRLHRSLDIMFSGETGDRKGSWKGGTIGHSIETTSSEEMHESAFRRYCDKHNMIFIGEASAVDV